MRRDSKHLGPRFSLIAMRGQAFAGGGWLTSKVPTRRTGTSQVEGNPGLVLVEAKANVPELGLSGKHLDSTASQASRGNHKRIACAIDEARTALRLVNPKVSITRDSHYQLSNRIAFTWKLASPGIPTVLVYLGFLGDQGIADAGEPFRDKLHWDDVFANYAHSLVPDELFERSIECGPARAWFLVRSRPVIQSSEPLLPHPRLRPGGTARF
jgi:hypothetical protein